MLEQFERVILEVGYCRSRDQTRATAEYLGPLAKLNVKRAKLAKRRHNDAMRGRSQQRSRTLAHGRNEHRNFVIDRLQISTDPICHVGRASVGNQTEDKLGILPAAQHATHDSGVKKTLHRAVYKQEVIAAREFIRVRNRLFPIWRLRLFWRFAFAHPRLSWPVWPRPPSAPRASRAQRQQGPSSLRAHQVFLPPRQAQSSLPTRRPGLGPRVYARHAVLGP